VVVVKDDPINILKRIVFFDDESRPIQKELTQAELEHYLDEIEKDTRYFGRSYAKAHVAVHIKGLCPGEAAEKIQEALDSLPERNVVKADQTACLSPRGRASSGNSCPSCALRRGPRGNSPTFLCTLAAAAQSP